MRYTRHDGNAVVHGFTVLANGRTGNGLPGKVQYTNEYHQGRLVHWSEDASRDDLTLCESEKIRINRAAKACGAKELPFVLAPSRAQLEQAELRREAQQQAMWRSEQEWARLMEVR